MSKILVVDDDRDICTLLAFKLEQGGHDVVIEHDGDAGLSAALSEGPDLVLLDWMMPGMTGLEVCLQLRSGPPLASVPVIMLTAKSEEADIRRGFAAGADDYVVKPFSPRELVGRVDALLHGVRG